MAKKNFLKNVRVSIQSDEFGKGDSPDCEWQVRKVEEDKYNNMYFVIAATIGPEKYSKEAKKLVASVDSAVNEYCKKFE